jgi:hypothetical protein
MEVEDSMTTLIHSRGINPINHTGARYAPFGYPEAKRNRINQQLKKLGASRYCLMRSEIRNLYKILHDGEQIMGIVYGRYHEGFAVLLATDRRVLYVDNKPLFARTDEITFDLVGGLSSGKVGMLATITLHTRIGDYTLKTMNQKSAGIFIEFIERRCLEHRLNGLQN